MRLSLAGYVDLTEDVDLAAAGRGELRRRIVPAAASSVDRRFLVFGGVAVLLLGLTAWALRRPPASVSAPAPTPGRGRAFDHSAPTPPRPDSLEYFGDFRLIGPGPAPRHPDDRADRRGPRLCPPQGRRAPRPQALERDGPGRRHGEAELDRIVLRLLSKAPELRYAAAEELVLDLRDFLNRAA